MPYLLPRLGRKSIFPRSNLNSPGICLRVMNGVLNGINMIQGESASSYNLHDPSSNCSIYLRESLEGSTGRCLSQCMAMWSVLCDHI